MPNTPIVITGCQRSGTTLLSLVLDSHPNIKSIDEDKFDFPKINIYLHAPWFPRFVSFKLPRYASVLSFIKMLKDLRVIWCIRDPIDAVWSMIKLQMKLDGTNTVAWAAHPAFAQVEVLTSSCVLDKTVKLDLAQDLRRLEMIANKNPKERTRQENIFTGALCWRVKNELPSLYISENINFHTVRYESLVTKPEATIKQILGYIGVSWSDNVLRHHELHDGVSIGNTSNTRPIDSSGVGSGKANFTAEEVELIKEVCNKTAEKWGYLFTAR